MLKEAQLAERQEALGAESWTTGTITTKMGNVHKLKNAAGRKSAAAIQAATPNALCGCVLRPRAGSGLGDIVFRPVLLGFTRFKEIGPERAIYCLV